MPLSAISLAVASSSSWPCSMHLTPASIGLADRARRVGVDGDIGAPVLRRLDRGPQLGHGVLGDVERIVGRGDAAAGHQLDLAGAEHQLLARALAHRAGSSAIAAAPTLAVGESSGRARQFVRQPEIAVAAGLRNERARRPDARAGY